ncbi:MAG: gluconokinase [Candidatus Heimdallarchaeota archaeon]
MKAFNPDLLTSPEAYPHSIKEEIVVRETHVSWVFLTGDYAYKIKKEVKFGDILDFSTLELRKKFCEKEVELNSRFSPDIYLGTFTIDENGIINGKGEIIEYGVLMKQLPEERLMSNLLAEKKVTASVIRKIALSLAEFHNNAEKVPEWGHLKFIEEKWDENFRTTSQFRKIDPDFRRKVEGFMLGNRGLFQERINEGRITDNHGDLQSHNIFLLPEEEVRIFDCIEFNPLLRYGDVAEDVGFLAMDIDYWDEPALSKTFVNAYIEHSGDEMLEENIAFFKSYRAYVRGKVYGFQATNEPNEEEKQKQLQKSVRYFELAHSYASDFA